MSHALVLALAETPVISDAGNTQLVIAALAGIATVVLLIVLAKLHPFLALMLGSGVSVPSPSQRRSTRSPPSRPGSARPWAASAS